MNQSVYVVHDRLAGLYGSPVCHVNKSCALRWFSSDVLSKSPYNRDLDLFYIGDFDTATGIMSVCAPEFVANMATLEASGGEAEE